MCELDDTATTWSGSTPSLVERGVDASWSDVMRELAELRAVETTLDINQLGDLRGALRVVW